MAKDAKFWENIKETFDFTDEILEQLTPEQKRVLEKVDELGQWKVVAEVTSCSHCYHHKQPGDRYVFEPGGKLLIEECTGPICVWGLAYMLPFAYMIFDRIIEGIDPNGINLRYIRCSDTTWRHGGTGECIYRIRAEKK